MDQSEKEVDVSLETPQFGEGVPQRLEYSLVGWFNYRIRHD
jgi:hypothetical protein